MNLKLILIAFLLVTPARAETDFPGYRSLPPPAASLLLQTQRVRGGALVEPHCAIDGSTLNQSACTSGAVTITPHCEYGPLQYLINTGAITFNAPADTSDCIIKIINGNGAGAITFAPSQWSGKTPKGDAFATAVTSTSTVTFTNGSASITWTANGLALNAPIYFTNSGGALPTNFVAGQIYYVQVQSTNTIEVATVPNFPGGQLAAPVVAGSAGTGTQTGNQPSVFDLWMLDNLWLPAGAFMQEQ